MDETKLHDFMGKAVSDMGSSVLGERRQEAWESLGAVAVQSGGSP
jgi:hypothetical protein